MKTNFKSIVSLSGIVTVLMMIGVPYAAADPILTQNNLVYKGAFKVPTGTSGVANPHNSFAYGGYSLAYNPTNNSLFLVGDISGELTAEISIPTPVISTSLASLPRSTVLQGFQDLTQGNMTKIGAGGTTIGAVGNTDGGGTGIGGLLVYGNKLIGTSFNGYDVSGMSVRSHFTANTNWNNGTTIGFNGMYTVGATPTPVPQAGFVDGYLADVPVSWQSALGGKVLVGQTGLSGINRTSRGPGAFVYNPDDLGNTTSGTEANPVAVSALAYYSSSHPSIGDYGTNNTLYFTMTTRIRGAVFPEGSKSVLFFGQTGLGADGKGTGCYGEGTSVKSQAKDNTAMNAYWAANPSATTYTCGGNSIVRLVPNVDQCCYDPTAASKGDHAFPYVYNVWAYSADDLAASKSGTYVVTAQDAANGRFVTETPVPLSILSAGQTVKPWNVKPYATWHLSFPIMDSTGDYRILGAAYDKASQRIFLSQYNGEANGERYPLIHVFEVKIGTTAPAGELSGTAVKPK